MNADTTKDLTVGELRSFGLTTGAIVAVLFGLVLPWIWDLGYPRWPWIFFGVLGFWALAAPASLRVVYRVWMRIGLMISKVTTPIILGVVFYLIVMPVGLLIRTIGGDPMHRRFDSSAETYRIDKQEQSTSKLENPY
jgi:hypothetical protein